MILKRFFYIAFLIGLFLTTQAQQRNEICVPNMNGYITLKCDFHVHTVFSDGLVWPTVRIDEAYREGLDAISLTEHIEYRPFKDDVQSDHNRSFEVAQKKAEDLDILLIKGSEITRPMAPGHFNAIFLDNSNMLDQKEYRVAFEEAKKQNAFMFWNHPGWDRQQPDTTLWFPEHTKLLDSGCMHGIEVSNGKLYSPEALEWCIEKNLTVIGTSDIHQPIQTDYDFAKGTHRTMTFVFAKERTEAGVREALENGRTLAWQFDNVIGKEELMRPFFENSIKIEEVKRTEKGVVLQITNLTDIPLILKKTAHDTSLVYFRYYQLLPHTRHTVQIVFTNGIKGGDMNFEVTNFIVRAGKGLQYTIKL